MTIRKGEQWGSSADGAVDAKVVEDDNALAAAAYARLVESGSAGSTFQVLSGDLLETIGGARPENDEKMLFPMDLGLVSLDDGGEVPFVGHVVAKHRFWSGPAAVVMNAAWLDTWYLGPRAHPNDGLLDVTVGQLSWSDRMQARNRVLSGSHLPHPELSTIRKAQWSHSFDRATPIRVDGVRCGRARKVVARIIPDAFQLLN